MASSTLAAPAHLYYRAGKTVYVDDATEEPPGAGTSSGGPYITAATLVGDQPVERASGVNVELENNTRVSFDSTTHYLLQGVLANDTSLPYSATETVNVAAGAVVNFVGGLNVLTRATILNGNQALIYNRTVNPDATVILKTGTEVNFEAATDTVKNGWLQTGSPQTLLGPGFSMSVTAGTYVTFANEVLFSAFGSLGSNQTVPTESNAYYGSMSVDAAPGDFIFEDGGVVLCTLDGDQAFPHGAAYDFDVTFLDASEIQFVDGAPVAGTLSGDQWATTLDDLDGWVWLKDETGVTFSTLTNGNLLVSGTAGYSLGNYLYCGSSLVTFREGDVFECFPDTKRLYTATVFLNQTLYYGPGRTVSAKGSNSTLLFDYSSSYVQYCAAASNQTLTTSGGTANVFTNDELWFSGGYYVP